MINSSTTNAVDNFLDINKYSFYFATSYNNILIEMTAQSASIFFDSVNAVLKARTPEQVYQCADEARTRYVENFAATAEKTIK